MASIFDIDPPNGPTPKFEEPARRSKNRESLTPGQVATGKRTLYQMVEEAFTTLQEAMQHADHPTAIKAAIAVLDRAGFGPKSTVDVNTTTINLSELSRDELAERASKIAAMLRGTPKIVDVESKPLSIN